MNEKTTLITTGMIKAGWDRKNECRGEGACLAHGKPRFNPWHFI